MTSKTIHRTVGAIAALFATAALAAPAQAGVTVLGNGLAKSCYDATATGWPKPRRAIESCDGALSGEVMRAADRAATYVNRGILLMRIGKYEDALKSYDRGLKIEPQLAEAQTNRGAALLLMNRPHDALDALNTSIAGEPSDLHSAYYNRAIAHEQLGDLEAAYYDFKTALRIKPDFEKASEQLERFELVPAS